MILTYSRRYFIEDIMYGAKIHTIREDKHNRWKPGMTIQHWYGNPRNKSKNPFSFEESRCSGVEDVFIINIGGQICVSVNDRSLTSVETILLAHNDGLSMDEFIARFVPLDGDTFTGKIIHWTSIRYSNYFEVAIFTEEEMLQHYGEKWFFLPGVDVFFAEAMYHLLGQKVTVSRYTSHDLYQTSEGYIIHPYMFCA